VEVAVEVEGEENRTAKTNQREEQSFQF
jgi:hypothetical protein